MAERDCSGVGSARRRRERPLLVVATRADDRRSRARSGLAPQSWCWASSSARGPTGTDACELSGKAAGCPEGARAASGCGPLLTNPCLGGGADGVDDTTTRFLLKKSSPADEEEEEQAKEEKRMRELQ